MTDKMQKYVTLPREMPSKRPTELRIQDHKEVYERVSQAEMERQASRCLQCGVPFCQHYCPVSNNIPHWLKATAEGLMKDAYELSQATNNLPETCSAFARKIVCVKLNGPVRLNKMAMALSRWCRGKAHYRNGLGKRLG